MELPVYHYEGNIVVGQDREYIQDYLDFPFEVPAGMGALRLRLCYSPLKVGDISNLITLGLFDPHGFRGFVSPNPPGREVVLSAGMATVGCIPGAILAGKWLAQLAIHCVVADTKPCTYSLDIELLLETDAYIPVNHPIPSRQKQVAPGKAGWLRGELHSHTVHSDGVLTVNELIAQAHTNQLDFLAITDHNTVSALREVENTALDGLLLIPGIEVTTFHGHALALGVERWVEWRTGYHGWTIEDSARLAREMGGLFIMAHPNSVGSPICTGCQWEYADFDLDLADAIEVWNSQWDDIYDTNPKSLNLWHSLQQGKRRMPVTCGSDFHEMTHWGEGVPFTYIYTGHRSTADVLEGIRKGRMIISSGPWLNMQISTGEGNKTAGIGDTLSTKAGQVFLTTGWEKVPQGAQLIVRNKQDVILSEHAAGTGSVQRWLDIQPDDRLWIELYAANGAMLAMTNPVYMNGPEGPDQGSLT